MSNIVSTSIVQKAMTDLILYGQNIKREVNEEQSESDIITEYKKNAKWVRKGCNFDIQKCFIDGKPLIIEGSHLDPRLYVKQEIDEGTGNRKLSIWTPDPEDEEESAAETKPIQKMREQM